MLRITQSVNAQAAKKYYSEGLSREGYYSVESVGRWGGQGAARLGLEGEVGKEQFGLLAENRNPQTGERLTARNREGRRVGWDFTFSVPKSVSVLHALSGDDQIRKAFERAVAETMAELEAEVQTRVRKGGKNSERTTGNLVHATYTHFTGRPTGGQPDPHLHQHVFVFNATFDEHERSWKAADIGNIKRDAPYWQAVVDARLARSLTDLGYRIERSQKGWEIAGVPETVREKFSRRTAEIEAEAERRGLMSDKAKDSLGAQTRINKEAVYQPEELRGLWHSRLNDGERSALLRVLEATRDKRAPENGAAKQAVDYALDHSLTRVSVVSERRLLADALVRGTGEAGVEDVRADLAARQDVLRGEQGGQTLVTWRLASKS